jgi:hypothetical protein
MLHFNKYIWVILRRTAAKWRANVFQMRPYDFQKDHNRYARLSSLTLTTEFHVARKNKLFLLLYLIK